MPEWNSRRKADQVSAFFCSVAATKPAAPPPEGSGFRRATGEGVRKTGRHERTIDRTLADTPSFKFDIENELVCAQRQRHHITVPVDSIRDNGRQEV